MSSAGASIGSRQALEDPFEALDRAFVDPVCQFRHVTKILAVLQVDL